MPTNLDSIRWPEAHVVAGPEAVAKARAAIITSIKVQIQAHPKESIPNRVKFMVEKTYDIVRTLVPLVDTFMEASSPDEKKRALVTIGMSILNEIEDELNVIPALFQGVVMQVLRHVLSSIVSHVYDKVAA